MNPEGRQYAMRQPITDIHHVELSELPTVGWVLLMDLEFTCWEGSLRTQWADPDRPPEIIEIGAVAYEVTADEVGDRFSSFVKPRKNPVLSEYCLGLLRIDQDAIDEAAPLEAVVASLERWLGARSLCDVPTGSWCSMDRVYLSRDADRAHCLDPFRGRPHLNIVRLLSEVLGEPLDIVLPRDEVRTKLKLAENPSRHRALGDALDLIQFCRWLRTRASGRR